MGYHHIIPDLLRRGLLLRRLEEERIVLHHFHALYPSATFNLGALLVEEGEAAHVRRIALQQHQPLEGHQTGGHQGMRMGRAPRFGGSKEGA